jgi:hypothetical protein
MLLGKLSGGAYSPLSGSAPKSAPWALNIPGVTAPFVPPPADYVTLPKTSEPVEEIAEIVVAAKKIPWYAWAFAGVVAYAATDKLLGGR